VRKVNRSRDFGDHRAASRYRNTDDRSDLPSRTTLGALFVARERASHSNDRHEFAIIISPREKHPRRLPARSGRSPTPCRSRHVNRRIGIAPSRPRVLCQGRPWRLDRADSLLKREFQRVRREKEDQRLKSSTKDQKTKSRKDQGWDASSLVYSTKQKQREIAYCCEKCCIH